MDVLLLLRSQRDFFSAVSSGDLDSVKRLLHHLTDNDKRKRKKKKKKDDDYEEEEEEEDEDESSPSSSPSPSSSSSSTVKESGGVVDKVVDDDDEKEDASASVPSPRCCTTAAAATTMSSPQLLLIRGGCLEKEVVGQTALHIAAHNSREEVLRYLLTFCDFDTAAIKSKDHGNRTAFHIAAREGHLGIVKEFLARWPALCKLCDDTNTSPVYDAAVRDHLDVVNAILDVDASSLRIVRKNGKTALHVAARRGYYRIVRALLDKDPGIVPIVDKKGQTALHMAVKGLNTDVVEEMLDVDVSILNLFDKKGNTALHVATRKWRQEMVCHLLNYGAIEVNAINNLSETAMDLAENVPYDKYGPEMIESLREAGARNARNVGKLDEASELRKTVSDIKHDVHTQLIQNAQTNKRVTGIAKELRKLHREAVQNTINSVTVVATLIASIAFVAIFNLPGQYTDEGGEAGKANIAETVGFRAFCLLNATALFISLAVVVVQITLVAWETGAQKLVVSIVNKLMWAACISTCGAFLSIAFVNVGKEASWMAITVTLIGGPVMVGTLGIMGYLVFRRHFKFNDDSQRRIRRGGGSKSFSMSLRSTFSDPDAAAFSDREKIYAL